MEDNNNNAIVVQRDATTCAPLVGTLISKGGKNTVVYNQEPSPEFVSNVELTCVYSNDKMAEFEEKMLNQVQNVANNKSVTNLFPISFFLKKKIDSSPNALALNGYGFAFHPLLVRLRMTAFTLAEVLITLGIIGVVAALTIPGLINNYKANRLRSQFLKSYSTAQQAFKMMEQDDVSLDPLTYNEDRNRKFYTAYMSYFQGVINCGGRAAGNKKTLPCYDVDDPSIRYESLDGKSQISSLLFDDGQFVLQDGTLFLMENDMRIKDRLYVSVDLNGFNTPPNRWGYDLFTFQFLDGELKTMGEMGTDYTDMDVYCNPKISNNLNGIACAQKAKSNSDYFKWVVKNLK